MVRFRTPNRPAARNYLSRREQWRLLVLVLSLGLVVILMGQIRRPESAAWLGLLLGVGPERPVPATQGSEPAERPPTELAQGSVGISAAPRNPPQYFPGVDPGLLPAIRDNTYFRSAEKDAWFNLLAVLLNTPADDLTAASIGRVDYIQLVEQPHVYRAQLVTVRGKVRQVTEQRPARNDLGLESYDRIVLQPAGGGIWPVFVYVLQLPTVVQPREDLSIDLEITGFYFKNLSYQWKGGLGIAPVLLAKNVAVIDADAVPSRTQVAAPSPEAADSWTAETDLVAGGRNGQLDELLSLAGWDVDRLANFGDDTELTSDQRQALAELLWRLRTLDVASLAARPRSDVPCESLLAQTDAHRGQLVRVAGRVRRVTRHVLSADDAARLEMPAYFECELELDGSAVATVLTARVPRAWLQMPQLDEPAAAPGLLVKRLPPRDAVGRVLLASPAIAWHPTVVREPYVSFGKSVLGTLGMDVGLLDGIQNRRGILASEREAFYQMLHAVGDVGASQLDRFAQGNLVNVRDAWAREVEELAGPADAPPGAAPADDAGQRRVLAEEVVSRAAEGRYSVAPLFNDADHQIGRLAVFEGTARRVVRINVGRSPDGSPSDVVRRFGIDHYYEVEVFTDDSQNYPLVFCLRELPAGFPTAGAIHEPVRVAGFFFKSWLYRTRKAGPDSEVGASAGLPQFAPLLVGRAPAWLEPDVAEGRLPELLGAGVFVAALAAVWGLVWWYARGDRQFENTVLAAKYSLPEGQSLDDLELPDDMSGPGNGRKGEGFTQMVQRIRQPEEG